MSGCSLQVKDAKTDVSASIRPPDGLTILFDAHELDIITGKGVRGRWMAQRSLQEECRVHDQMDAAMALVPSSSRSCLVSSLLGARTLLACPPSEREARGARSERE